MNDPHWRDKALCRGQSDEPWFPDLSRGRDGNRVAFKTALDVIGRYCESCPVRVTCDGEAERLEDELGATITGVWGGNLRYRSRKSENTTETSHVLSARELRGRLALEPDPEPEPAPTSATPVCRWCHTPVGKRKNGSLRAHTIPGTIEACPGMGMPPADEQVA